MRKIPGGKKQQPRLCPECQGQVAPGVRHQCTVSEKERNVGDLLRSLPEKRKERIVSQIIKGKTFSEFLPVLISKCLDKRDETGDVDFKLTTGGKPLPVKLPGKGEAEKTLDYESSRKLQVTRHFSDNDLRYLASNNDNTILYYIFIACLFCRAIEKTTRDVFGRKSVEAGSREARVEENNRLRNYFKGSQMKFKQKPKTKDEAAQDEDGLVTITRPVVICTDVRGLLNEVLS